MFPLAAIGTGLSFLGGLGGLVGSGNAERAAQQQMEEAIRGYSSGAAQQYSDQLQSGQQQGMGLVGTLNSELGSMGRGLGASLAGAGVYNSSAAAGALANQGAANAQQVAGFNTNLANVLANLKDQAAQHVADLQYGTGQNNLNFARQQQAGAFQGLASFLGSLSQFNAKTNGVNQNNPNTTGTAVNGATNSVLQMPYSSYNSTNSIPYGLPSYLQGKFLQVNPGY